MTGRGRPLHSRKPPVWAAAVASVGGIGFCPVAPGTVASGFAAAVYWLAEPLQHASVLVPVMVAAFVLGGFGVRGVLRQGGEDADPPHVVCDEVVGQWLALLSPAYAGRWEYVLLAFLWFRVFDVLKPPPASFFDRRKGPWNVMMDDVAAGGYANLASHLCLVLGSAAVP